MSSSLGRVLVSAFRYHPAVGGAEQLTRRLLKELGPTLDVRVATLLTENRSDWLTSLIAGVRDDDLEYSVDGRRVVAHGRWPLATRAGMRTIEALYHAPFSPVPGAMAGLLAPHLRPLVREVGLVHNVFMGREAYSMAFLLECRRARIPFVFTPLRHQRILGWNSPAFLKMYREAAALIALTGEEARWLIDHGAAPGRVHVAGMGPLADPGVSPAYGSALAEGRQVVLFIGQLHRYKGYRTLLQVAAKFEKDKSVLFVFAGPDVAGNSRDFDVAGPNVRYLGKVSDAERDSLLVTCSVVCVPSSRESFGGVFVDAWACGRPVVGGPAPAVAEVISDGEDGFVVPQDPDLLAGVLGRLLGDADLRGEMGAAGQLKVKQKYSWIKLSDAHRHIYESVAR